MSIAAEKVAEGTGLTRRGSGVLGPATDPQPGPDRGPDAEAQWQEVIDRRSREMLEGHVDALPEDEMVREIRRKLNARPPTS